jgi:hypothetical protein
MMTYLKYIWRERIVLQDELKVKRVTAKRNPLEVINNKQKRTGYCKIV